LPRKNRTRRAVRAGTLGLLALAIVSSAQNNGQREPLCSEDSKSRVEVADANMSILGLAIGHASLKDVQARLGNARTVPVSKEEESDVALCYVSPTDGTVLIFYSGSMAGWVDVTGFALWAREAQYPRASDCLSSKLVSRSLATTGGVRLGLTKEELQRLLGQPTGFGKASIKYQYVCRRKMTDDEIKRFKTVNNWDVASDPYFDVSSTVDVRLIDSQVSRLQISKIESY